MAKGDTFFESLKFVQDSKPEPQSVIDSSAKDKSNSSEQNNSRVIPKAPSFITPDPIDSYLRSSGIEDGIQEMIWELYEGDQNAAGDDVVNFRRKLGTDKTFLNNYINSLIERAQRGEKPYGANGPTYDAGDFIKRMRQYSRGIGVEGVR